MFHSLMTPHSYASAGFDLVPVVRRSKDLPKMDAKLDLILSDISEVPPVCEMKRRNHIGSCRKATSKRMCRGFAHRKIGHFFFRDI
jgi:hypothetical protein